MLFIAPLHLVASLCSPPAGRFLASQQRDPTNQNFNSMGPADLQVEGLVPIVSPTAEQHKEGGPAQKNKRKRDADADHDARTGGEEIPSQRPPALPIATKLIIPKSNIPKHSPSPTFIGAARIIAQPDACPLNIQPMSPPTCRASQPSITLPLMPAERHFSIPIYARPQDCSHLTPHRDQGHSRSTPPCPPANLSNRPTPAKKATEIRRRRTRKVPEKQDFSQVSVPSTEIGGLNLGAFDNKTKSLTTLLASTINACEGLDKEVKQLRASMDEEEGNASTALKTSIFTLQSSFFATQTEKKTLSDALMHLKADCTSSMKASEARVDILSHNQTTLSSTLAEFSTRISDIESSIKDVLTQTSQAHRAILDVDARLTASLPPTQTPKQESLDDCSLWAARSHVEKILADFDAKALQRYTELKAELAVVSQTVTCLVETQAMLLNSHPLCFRLNPGLETVGTHGQAPVDEIPSLLGFNSQDVGGGV